MPPTSSWNFPPFRLDPATASLWRGEQLVPLPPKPFAVLAHLVAHSGEVVTKEDLLDAVWPETAVTEGVLKGCIRQIRQVLGETAEIPRYIVTVHRRGYRFIAPVIADEPPPAVAERLRPPLVPTTRAEPGGQAPPTDNQQLATAPNVPMTRAEPGEQTPPRAAVLMVGREVELAQLHQLWRRACQGTRQMVFLTGEAGIGKTTLVDTFIAQLQAKEEFWLGRGQSIEHYGVGEAYLPLLEALGQLGRGPEQGRLVELLRQLAPNWLLQLPALVSDDAIELLHRRVSGTTPERMLRELAEAVETLVARRPLVLVLEDLHWSDGATLDWLGYIARRRLTARLLILGTYRPTDAIIREHPVHMVAQELQLHGQAREMVLAYLPETAVAVYLTRRFGEQVFPEEFVRTLHQRTNGNPLFLVMVVDALVRQGVLGKSATDWERRENLEATVVEVPDSLKHLIEQQLAHLSVADRERLEVASVAGVKFTATAVADVVGDTVETVEERCEGLARQGQFLQVQGPTEWPDGTVATRYEFLHGLYREILYMRVPVSRRMRWHRQIGTRLETGYGPQARQIAAELAEHFVQGRDADRAVRYLQYAGEQALQRSAHQEALQHLTRGLDLIAELPDTPARLQQELDLQVALGPALIAAKGPAAPEVEQTYARTRALCMQVGETPHLFSTLWGLCLFYLNRGLLPTARQLGEQLYQLAQRQATSPPLLEAHDVLGITLFYMGEYATAQRHLEKGRVLSHSATLRALAHHHDVAFEVTFLAMAANTLWCLGYPTQAVERCQEALDVAQTLDHPQSMAVAQHFAASLYYRLRETAAVQAQADALVHLATAQALPLWVSFGTCWHGWALAMQGDREAGMAQLQQGVEAGQSMGQTLTRSLWLVLLAEVIGHGGRVKEGMSLLAEAITGFAASARGDLLGEAYRLQGEFLLHPPDVQMDKAEASLQKALAIARGQQARSWELRVAVSLARLWQQWGKCQDAHDLLAPVYGWFTEGFATADLQEAKVLLEELGG